MPLFFGCLQLLEVLCQEADHSYVDAQFQNEVLMAHVDSTLPSKEAHIHFLESRTELTDCFLDLTTFNFYHGEVEILAAPIELRNEIFLKIAIKGY